MGQNVGVAIKYITYFEYLAHDIEVKEEQIGDYCSYLCKFMSKFTR